ncbi:MAG: ribulose-bisphosphate carboxylase, partial [Actinomycetes bacterium]|nr:ribulose-bisphosphate carboxylase [Actinomycetes bacterium]MDX5380024.1 ribulose-bisphosphate carboxylase [Actinomycetes bacterium]MDX5398571.1 ribulose-bisphosphate carboxylase [Actinomycetes bacterium]MDX5449727.1 ribulose-bisphosphate carboxylase [Actinomycetes bacterium]
MDQSARYADLSLSEEELISGGKHILCAYKMKPKAGHGYLEAAAHFAAESSTGTNVEVSTTDDFTKGVDALVYHIDEATEEMRIAYPLDLFDRNMIDGRMMMVSFLTLTIGNNQGMGDIEHAKMYDFYVPRRAIELFDGPAVDISTLWRILGRPVEDGGYIAGTIIKPKLGLRPEPFANAAYDFWLGGDFIKNDEPQGNQVFAPMRKTIPLVYDAMKRAMDETGEAKLFSANITADDHAEMIARGEFILQSFGPDADKVAFLVDGYVGGPGMVTTARRYFSRQYLHYHRAGHGAVTSPSAKRGYTAYVLAKMARLQGASGIHVGTMGYGKMEGGKDDRAIAYIIEREEYQGPAYFQKWYGMRPTTPIISGGMNALRLPGFFENLGHANVINTAGGGSYGHVDGAAAGARSLRQAYECWAAGADPVEWAKEHREFARAF